MNQSKKLLAALVAVPASVVVADGAFAAEETVTFNINNEFLNGSVPTVTGSVNNTPILKGAVLPKINKFEKSFTIALNVNNSPTNQTKLAFAEQSVRELMDYLKANLNGQSTIGTEVIDHTTVYGLMSTMNVKVTEMKNENGVVDIVNLTFDVSYLTNASYKTGLITPTLSQINVASGASDLLKVKAVHDFLINKKYVDSKGITLDSINTTNTGMSRHIYSMYTYLLLKKLGVEVKYVYGLNNGSFTSWNLVKVNGTYYPLDVAGNDNTIANNRDVLYKYFLTADSDVGTREIYFGQTGVTISNTSYNKAFINMKNPVFQNNTLYYADSAENGEVYKLVLGPTNTAPEVIQSGATSSTGGILVPGATALYFINTSDGNNVYVHSFGNGVTNVGIKANVETISIANAKLTFKIAGETTSRTIDLSGGLDEGFATYVANQINAIVLKTSTEINDTYRKQVLTAQKLFNMLTDTQKTSANRKLVNAANENHLTLLEQSVLPENSDIHNIINAINTLDISKSTFIEDMTAVETLLQAVSIADQQAIYNLSVYQAANEELSKMKAIEGEIQAFYNTYGGSEVTENTFPTDFYKNLESLIEKYYALHRNLKRNDFTPIITGLKNLGDSEKAHEEIDKLKNQLNTIHIESISYLSDVSKLKQSYDPLTNAQKGLLTADEKARIERHITQMSEMQKVVAELKQYVSAINDINNTVIPPTPEELKVEFINKIKHVKGLLDIGIKPSQWDALKSATPATLAQFTEKVNAFLARVQAEQRVLSTKAIAVREELIRFETAFPSTLEAIDYENIAAYVTAVNNLISKLAGTDLAGSANNLQLILSMITDSAVLNVWERHTTLKANLQTDVTAFNTKVSVHTSAPLTEVVVDELLKQYDEADIVFKYFVKDAYEDLQNIKKELDENKDKEAASALVGDMSALLFKELNSKDVTYVEAKVVWDKYETGSATLKAEVEAAIPTFENFTAFWKKLKADEQKIQDLIDEIKALTKDSTKEELEAVKAKYDALNPEQQKLVDNYKDLAALEEKEQDKQDALDKADADAVIKKIAELTDESTATEIAAVRAAYVALNENAKKLVSARTLELLTYYEARIEELIEIAQKEAAVVQDRINRITSSYTEAQIKNIRMAFNALSELAKTYITNLQKLIEAENNIIYQNTVVKQAKLDANAFDVYMNDINRNSTTAEIAKARAYYNRLSGEAKKHVTTYEKLVRLETMWKDPEYLDLVFTYYPEYVNAVKPGAIVIEKPSYDPLYIPDDSTPTPSSTPVVAANPVTSWSPYESMRYQNGRYTTTISATQVNHVMDRNMRLKADDIEIVIPTLDLRAATAAVGVSVTTTNNQLNIQFTQGTQAKVFSEYVEIHLPFSVLKGNASQIIERVTSAGSSVASFKVDGSTFIIRTKTGGIFKTATASTYSDIPAGAQGTAIRELAKRGIQFNTTSRLSQSYKEVTKMDVALMIATALDISSNKKSKYQDLESETHSKRVQGLLEAGIMSGATSANFNANGTVTKQEAAIIIANMYRYLNQDLAKAYNNLTSNYRDVAGLTLEARQSIAILELFGVVSGTGAFEPTQPLTRGEFAELIYKALTAVDYL